MSGCAWVSGWMGERLCMHVCVQIRTVCGWVGACKYMQIRKVGGWVGEWLSGCVRANKKWVDGWVCLCVCVHACVQIRNLGVGGWCTRSNDKSLIIKLTNKKSEVRNNPYRGCNVGHVVSVN